MRDLSDIDAVQEARIERLAARFEPLMVDDRHRRLARRALHWALQAAGDRDEGELAKDVFLSSTFDIFCAPPLATMEQRLLDMRFLLFFFELDDASPERITAHLAGLTEARCGSPGGPGGDLRSRHDDLIATLGAMGRDADCFQRAVVDMCTSMHAEKTSDMTTVTEDVFRRLRKHTIAVPAHSEWWRALLGITFTPPLHGYLRSSSILDLACELIYLVNDLGSLERDEQAFLVDPRKADPNYVLLRARLSGDRETAIREVVTLHDTLLGDFRDVERELRGSQHGADPALGAYVDILRGMVKGNLAATRHLAPMRYAGAGERLARLEEL